MNNWDGIISLFIACLELVLIINILIFSEKTPAVKAGIFIIALLLIYQAAEFYICGLDFKNQAAVYFAFSDISLLPGASFLFASRLAGRQSRIVYTAFIPAAFFIIYYFFHISEMQAVKCTVFYAAYNYPLGSLYGFFYYSLIIISIIFLYLYRKKEKRNKERVLTAIVIAGFIFTALPVITAFTLSVSGNRGLLDIIESVMCKFAFSIALSVGVFCLSYFKRK